MGLLEKQRDEDGYYAVILDDRLLFRAADNKTIEVIAKMLSDLSKADDFATIAFKT